MATSWIEYKTKKILYVDYRGCKNDDELLNLLQEELEIEKTLTAKILVLGNFTGIYVGSRYMDAVKKAGKEIRNIKTARTALVGVEGIKKILLSGYLAFTGDKNTKAFDNEMDAKEWLVS